MSDTTKSITLRTTANDNEQRIDNFLFKHYKKVPKSRIYRLLRSRQVRVNHKRVKHLYRIVAGDVVTFPQILQEVTQVCRQPSAHLVTLLTSRIVYEDSELLIINKPAGIATHGGSGISFGVIEALRAVKGTNLGLVHRLDRATSGILVLAKKRSTLRVLHEQLRQKQVRKHYLVLVRGSWQESERKVTCGLKKNCLQSGERMVTVTEDGKMATTLFRLQRNFGSASLLEAELQTGRTHQIRVHAAYVGHPVAGDEKYGAQDFNRRMRHLGLQRLFLHASSIKLVLPSGKEINIQVPLDVELANVLKNYE